MGRRCASESRRRIRCSSCRKVYGLDRECGFCLMVRSICFVLSLLRLAFFCPSPFFPLAVSLRFGHFISSQRPPKVGFLNSTMFFIGFVFVLRVRWSRRRTTVQGSGFLRFSLSALSFSVSVLVGSFYSHFLVHTHKCS